LGAAGSAANAQPAKIANAAASSRERMMFPSTLPAHRRFPRFGYSVFTKDGSAETMSTQLFR
jgi:hypothetical protein